MTRSGGAATSLGGMLHGDILVLMRRGSLLFLACLCVHVQMARAVMPSPSWLAWNWYSDTACQTQVYQEVSNMGVCLINRDTSQPYKSFQVFVVPSTNPSTQFFKTTQYNYDDNACTVPSTPASCCTMQRSPYAPDIDYSTSCMPDYKRGYSYSYVISPTQSKPTFNGFVNYAFTKASDCSSSVNPTFISVYGANVCIPITVPEFALDQSTPPGSSALIACDANSWSINVYKAYSSNKKDLTCGVGNPNGFSDMYSFQLANSCMSNACLSGTPGCDNSQDFISQACSSPSGGRGGNGNNDGFDNNGISGGTIAGAVIASLFIMSISCVCCNLYFRPLCCPSNRNYRDGEVIEEEGGGGGGGGGGGRDGGPVQAVATVTSYPTVIQLTPRGEGVITGITTTRGKQDGYVLAEAYIVPLTPQPNTAAGGGGGDGGGGELSAYSTV